MLTRLQPGTAPGQPGTGTDTIQVMTTTRTSDHGRTRWTTGLAVALFAVAVGEAAAAGVGVALAGMTLTDAVGSFLVTNIAIGLSCAVSGVLIAWQRPRNPVGWLLAAAGLFQTMTAAAAPFTVAARDQGWSAPVTRTLTTMFLYGWPWSIGLLLPLALLLFPTGTPPGPGWRWLLFVSPVAGLVFVVASGAAPGGVDGTGQLTGWLVLPNYEDLAWLWQTASFVVLGTYVAALVGLVVRYRRGDERLRRQLLWLCLALLLAVVVLALWGPLVPGLAVLNLLVIAAIPVSMTIAVLRYQLLDIRLVLSRTVLYVLLSAGVVGAYLALVAIADRVLRVDAGLGASAVVTLLIAVGFNPVRVRLQRVVDRALYGDRADPVRAVARMGKQMAVGGQDDMLRAVIDALRLPYAALRIGGHERACSGVAPQRLHTVPLSYQNERVGELVVGARSGQHRLTGADQAALELLAAPLAVAAHATTLSEDLQRSRERIVTSREEERRRLRRDLHDGLGPALTGMAFQADAAKNLVRSDPGKTEELLTRLRDEVAEAIADVRRLVYALHPPALDQLGLAEALRRYIEQLDASAPIVTADAPETLAPLPAAVEVAAYRIATEAITNALRHANAQHIKLRVDLTGHALLITVDDDGPGNAEAWTPGVGLTSMRERAAEIGGTVTAGPEPHGGRVIARLPVGISAPVRIEDDHPSTQDGQLEPAP